jgi:hypothetical protein
MGGERITDLELLLCIFLVQLCYFGEGCHRKRLILTLQHWYSSLLHDLGGFSLDLNQDPNRRRENNRSRASLMHFSYATVLIW